MERIFYGKLFGKLDCSMNTPPELISGTITQKEVTTTLILSQFQSYSKLKINDLTTDFHFLEI